MMRTTMMLIPLLLLTASAQATVPERMHYQGYLTNAQGEAVHCPDALSCPDQSFAVTFRLYDQAEGGDPIWVETHHSVSVVRGTFDVALGDVNPLEAAKVTDPAWIGVEINGAGEMSPRQRLVSSAFALRAGNAESADLANLADDSDRLGGFDADEYAKVSEMEGLCVTDDELTQVLSEESYLNQGELAVYLTEEGYVPGALFSGHFDDLEGIPEGLSDGDQDTLGMMSCQAGNIIRFDGVSWQCSSEALSMTEAGDLVFSGTVIINADGDWVGSPAGLQGPPGQAGPQGQTSLVVASQEGPSAACPDGGARINSGFDLDDSGSLDAAEVSATSVVCNGPKGDDGAPATQALLATVALPESDPACVHGGVRVNTGLDTDGDGALGASEVTSISAVCHGAPGPKGDPGSQGVGVLSAEVNATGALVVTLSDGTIYESDSLIGPKGADGQLAQAGCAEGEILQYDGSTWQCTAHANNPDAHHSAISQGLAIAPASVTIEGTSTALTEGKLDLGAGANDEVTAAMLETLTGGGNADALHTHASSGGTGGSGGGGGSCYTALGTDVCGAGYAAMYSGVLLTSAEGSWGGTGNMCVKMDAVVDHGTTTYYDSFFALGNARRYKSAASEGVPCAMCCP